MRRIGRTIRGRVGCRRGYAISRRRSPAAGLRRPATAATHVTSSSAGSGLLRVVALRDVAAEPREIVQRLLALDAFGDDGEAEVVAEVDRRADDHGVVLVAFHLHHERLVDLEHVDREPFQVAERRVAAAEIVDRERDAQLAEPVEHRAGAQRIREDRALRDLELEVSRLDPCLAEQAGDLLGEVEVEHVAAREIDGHRELEALLAPGAALAQPRLEHVERERPDQAGVLGERDEVGGYEQAALRVLPAHERLHRAHAAVLEARLRLVIERQLAPLERVAALADREHRYHALFEDVRDRIGGACAYCSKAFGVRTEVEQAGITLLEDFEQHPSLRSYIAGGYQVLTF
jgi:hypothetical protein